MIQGRLRDLPAATRSVEEAGLDQIGFVDVFKGASVFLDGGSQGLDSHWSTAEFVDDRQQDVAVHLVETGGVHPQPRERVLGHRSRDLSLRLHLRLVTNPCDEPVDEARRTTSATGNFLGPCLIDSYPEQAG